MFNAPHHWLGTDKDYQKTWDFQIEQVAKITAGEASDQFYYLEHAPVYTIGRTRDQSSLKNPTSLPHPQTSHLQQVVEKDSLEYGWKTVNLHRLVLV